MKINDINRKIELLKVELRLASPMELDGFTGVYQRLEELEDVINSSNNHLCDTCKYNCSSWDDDYPCATCDTGINNHYKPII